MRFAVISDIHGNKDALHAVIKDIRSRKINDIFNLGDSLYGPLFPIETYRMIKEANIKSIKGNCDRLLESNFSENPTVQYCIDKLEEEHREWLRNLPFSIEVDDLYFCHASPTSDEEYLVNQISNGNLTIKDNNELVNESEKVTQNIIFCGHSHIPMITYLPNNKVIVNPGSVGLPAYEEFEPFYYKMESGNPLAKYVIVEKIDNEYSFEQISIPYNTSLSIFYSNLNNRKDWATALEKGKF